MRRARVARRGSRSRSRTCPRDPSSTTTTKYVQRPLRRHVRELRRNESRDRIRRARQVGARRRPRRARRRRPPNARADAGGDERASENRRHARSPGSRGPAGDALLEARGHAAPGRRPHRDARPHALGQRHLGCGRRAPSVSTRPSPTTAASISVLPADSNSRRAGPLRRRRYRDLVLPFEARGTVEKPDVSIEGAALLELGRRVLKHGRGRRRSRRHAGEALGGQGAPPNPMDLLQRFLGAPPPTPTP